MLLHAPQLIYLSLCLMGFGIELVQHGTPKKGKHNAFTSVGATCFILTLLWWGGFFHK